MALMSDVDLRVTHVRVVAVAAVLGTGAVSGGSIS
jgi:hypothetical protein